MNKQDYDILRTIFDNKCFTQRLIAEESGYALGTVNKSVKSLGNSGFLDEHMKPTNKAFELKACNKPENAIILAAGFGMRMVPINTETPKALLTVKGEVLIERHIKHLKEAGVDNIYIIVGFMKEAFEYLIDKYDVKLIVNSDYSTKNNLFSLKRAIKYIGNSYIIPCDIWCEANPYRDYEFYSWYMVSTAVDRESSVKVNRKQELVLSDTSCNRMIGIAYISKVDSNILNDNIISLCESEGNSNCFWESALIECDRFFISARIVTEDFAVEINTYEQLRELDSNSLQLKTEAISVIASAMNVNEKDIKDIVVLKKGMTNRSFLFKCNDKRYIMRIPGEGTGMLINRKQEASVYQKLKGKGICDNIIYINPDNGYKITEYIDGARVCNPNSDEDLIRCMKKLREFHQLGLKVEHTFDIFGQIDFYEKLWNGVPSAYKDYEMTKEKVLSLEPYIDDHVENVVLTHIDAVPDNFLFDNDDSIKLIDWEYAGMQDPHVDIAMFCIYALYDRSEVDHLIDIYFENNCQEEIRTKIYCYVAVCGLLWSNWCEYKRTFGIEFGEYSLRQYRYAKDFYKLAIERINAMRGED